MKEIEMKYGSSFVAKLKALFTFNNFIHIQQFYAHSTILSTFKQIKHSRVFVLEIWSA